MFKISKIFTAAALALGLSLGAVASADASPATTLTYAEFTASANYADLQAAMDASNAYVNSRSNIVIDLVTTESSAGQTLFGSTVNIKANKTSAKATITMPDPVSGTNVTMDYGFANGSYYQAASQWSGLQATNAQAALKRLGKTLGSSVVLETATAPDGFTEIDPASMFNNSKLNLTNGVASDPTGLTFSEITKSDDATVAGATDYSYSIATPGNILFGSMTLDMVVKVDSNSMIYETALSGGIPGLLDLNIVANLSSPDTLDVAPPTDLFTASAFVKLDKQISAEKLVASKATAIAKKAKTLAGKKPVAGSHITAAAKALKYTVSSVKNGVKLTTKYKGVSGSMCVIATKGAAVVGNC